MQFSKICKNMCASVHSSLVTVVRCIAAAAAAAQGFARSRHRTGDKFSGTVTFSAV